MNGAGIRLRRMCEVNFFLRFILVLIILENKSEVELIWLKIPISPVFECADTHGKKESSKGDGEEFIN